MIKSLQYHVLVLITVLVCAGSTLHAQIVDSLSNSYHREVHTGQDSFFLHYHSIVRASVVVTPITKQDVPAYRITNSYLVWQNEQAMPDSAYFRVDFRVYPFDFDRWYSRFDSLMYRDGMMQALDPITFDPNATGQPIIEQTV